MPFKILTPLLCLGILLAWGIGDVNPQVKDLASSDPNRRYILPTYPELPARALINADLELELILDRNRLKSTNVLSCSAADSTMRNADAFCKDFVTNTGYALGQWHFSGDSSTWKLKVSFRSRTTNDDDKSTYYLYYADGESLRIKCGGVNEGSAFASAIPKEIIVEYHFPLPEIYGNPLPSKKRRWYWPF